MKKISLLSVMLKRAVELTDSQMRKVMGGYDPEKCANGGVFYCTNPDLPGAENVICGCTSDDFCEHNYGPGWTCDCIPKTNNT